MTVARNQGFEILDFTPLTELQPRIPKFITDLGLFTPFYGSTTIAQVERVEDGIDAISAQSRGGNRNYAGRETAIQRNFNTAFFPLDSRFTAQEIQDLKEYGTTQVPASMQNRINRTQERIAKSHASLKERAYYAAVFQGASYAPNYPQAQYDYATEFGVTAKVKPQFDVNFADEATDPRTTIEQQARQHIQKYAGDAGESYRVVAIVGSRVFDALKDHPRCREAYSQYPSESEPLRNRLGGDVLNRSWETEGVLYLEDFMGQQIGALGADEAYFLPLGIADMFQCHYSPADHKDYANTVAQEQYMFLLEDHRTSTVETETSFICVNTRPELVVPAKIQAA